MNIAIVPDIFRTMAKQSTQSDFLSRSALAEQLGMPLKDLTQLMIESGWIIQEEKVWQLTAKGEFEGGIYRQSQKYGQYIVWPSSIIDHPVIRDSGQSLVSVSTLSKQVGISARLLNRLLAEIAWIEAYAKGWQLTVLGRENGGVQCHDDESGIPYVMWPRAVSHAAIFKESINSFTSKESLESLDGRKFSLHSHCAIANWLYLLGMSYSTNRQLMVSPEITLVPDFYLPAHHLCIDYWSDSLSPAELANQLQKRDAYTNCGLNVVELKDDDFSDLDQALSKHLLQAGITTY
ncbi:MAG: hypothetical protein ACRBCI_13115 [Cellvibrionaceae bacterium]